MSWLRERQLRRRPRLLLVDDDTLILESASRVFGSEFTVVTAESGEEAMNILKKEDPFSVIVTDMCMPGMNGAELLAHAKTHWPETARILLTGAADLRLAAAAVNQGHVMRFLVKPCDPDELLRAVLEGCTKSRGQIKKKIASDF